MRCADVLVQAVGIGVGAQDDGELFDLCDAEGRPTGRAKARPLVHRDGDWHRSVHVWVVLRDPAIGVRVILQRRSLAKDTWPGAIDVAVAGHLRAGERIEDALRESEEEIGIALGPEDVVRLGVRFRVDASRAGVVDREIQEVFAAVVEASFASLRPDPVEVDAVVALAPADAAELLSGRIPVARARRLDARTRAVDEADVRAEELVAAPDGYWPAAIAAVIEVEAGRAPVPLRLGRGRG